MTTNTSRSLSETEIQQIAVDVAAGFSPRIWFTADAVGVSEGRSGRVVAVTDPAETDYLHVRPTRSTDTLVFSPAELTLTKPARDRMPHRTGTEPATLFDVDGDPDSARQR